MSTALVKSNSSSPKPSPTRTDSGPVFQRIQKLFGASSSSPLAASTSTSKGLNGSTSVGGSGRSAGFKESSTYGGGVGEAPSRARSNTTLSSSSSRAPSALWSRSYQGHNRTASSSSTIPSSISSGNHASSDNLKTGPAQVTKGGRAVQNPGVVEQRFAFPSKAGAGNVPRPPPGMRGAGGSSFVASLGLQPLVDSQGHQIPLYAPLVDHHFSASPVVPPSPPGGSNVSLYTAAPERGLSLPPLLSLFVPTPTLTTIPPTPDDTPPTTVQRKESVPIFDASGDETPKFRPPLSKRASASVPDLRLYANTDPDLIPPPLFGSTAERAARFQSGPSRSTGNLVGLGVSSSAPKPPEWFPVPATAFEHGGSRHVPVSVCEAYSFPKPRLIHDFSPPGSPVSDELDFERERDVKGKGKEKEEETEVLELPPVRFADDVGSVRRVLRENELSQKEREEWGARGRKRSRQIKHKRSQSMDRARSGSRSAGGYESGFESDNSIGISWSRRHGVRVWATRRREMQTQTDDEGGGDDTDIEDASRPTLHFATPPRAPLRSPTPLSFDPFSSIIGRVRSISFTKHKNASESRLTSTPPSGGSSPKVIGRKRSASDAQALRRLFAPGQDQTTSSLNLSNTSIPNLARMRSASLDSLYIRNPGAAQSSPSVGGRQFSISRPREVFAGKQAASGSPVKPSTSVTSFGEGIRRVRVPSTDDEKEALRFIPSRPPPPIPSNLERFATLHPPRTARQTAHSPSSSTSSLAPPLATASYWSQAAISAQAPVPPLRNPARLRRKDSKTPPKSPAEVTAQYELEAERAWHAVVREAVGPSSSSYAGSLSPMMSPVSTSNNSPNLQRSDSLSAGGESPTSLGGSRKSRASSSVGNASMLTLDEGSSFKDLFFRPPPPSRFGTERFSGMTITSQAATIRQDETPPGTPIALDSHPEEQLTPPLSPSSSTTFIPSGLVAPVEPLLDFSRRGSEVTIGSTASQYSTTTEDLDALFNTTIENTQAFLAESGEGRDDEEDEPTETLPAAFPPSMRSSMAPTEGDTAWLTADEGDDEEPAEPEKDSPIVSTGTGVYSSPASTPSPRQSRSSSSAASTEVGDLEETPLPDDTFGQHRPSLDEPTERVNPPDTSPLTKEVFGTDDADGRDSPPGNRPSFLDFTTPVAVAPQENPFEAPISPSLTVPETTSSPPASPASQIGSGSPSFIEFDGDRSPPRSPLSAVNSSSGSFLDWTPPNSPSRLSIPYLRSPVPEIYLEPGTSRLGPPPSVRSGIPEDATTRDSYLSADSLGMSPYHNSRLSEARTSYGSFSVGSNTSLLDVFPEPPPPGLEEKAEGSSPAPGLESIAETTIPSRRSLLGVPSMATIRQTRSMGALRNEPSRSSFAPSTSSTSDWTVESTQDGEDDDGGVRRRAPIFIPGTSRSGASSFLDLSDDQHHLPSSEASPPASTSTRRWSGASWLTFFSASKSTSTPDVPPPPPRPIRRRSERTTSDPSVYNPRGGWENVDERR